MLKFFCSKNVSIQNVHGIIQSFVFNSNSLRNRRITLGIDYDFCFNLFSHFLPRVPAILGTCIMLSNFLMSSQSRPSEHIFLPFCIWKTSLNRVSNISSISPPRNIFPEPASLLCSSVP